MSIAVVLDAKERVRASRHGSATRDSITLVLVCFLGLPVGAAGQDTPVFAGDDGFPGGDSTPDVATKAVAMGDVDGDGDLDLLVGNYGANELLLNDGDGAFSTADDFSGGDADTKAVAMGDVDGDGDLDLLVGNYDGANELLLNDGDGAFSADDDFPGGSYGTQAVAMGDVDGDGDLDLLVGDNGANDLLLNDGDGGFSADADYEYDAAAYADTRAVAMGDVDGDGDLDLLVGNIDGANELLLNDGDGVFSADADDPGGSYAGTAAVAMGDVDGDGDLDLLVGNYGANELLLNDGDGAFSAADDFSGGDADTKAVAMGDVDGDGDLDLLVGNYGANELLLNDGDGAFSAADDFSGGAYSYTNAVAMGDVDGDGDLDLLIGNEDDGANELLLNVVPPSPPSPPSSAGDDPTFIGADGLPYEVRGEPWKYFNLLSTPRLSLNAQFLPVPERFVHGKITDTVLGTLHLALCDAPRNRVVGVTFDVFDGTIGCTVRPPGEELGSSEQAPCAEVLPLAGATFTTEPGMCNMATMECGFVPPELNLTASMQTNPALVRVHMVRYNVSVFGTNLSLVRDVVDRPDPLESLGCGSLSTAWKRARRACETLSEVLRGESPLAAWLALPAQDRIATLARASSGNRTRQLRFYNALVQALPYAQGDVHGLLGQRSVSPAPMRATAVGPNPLGALALSTVQLQGATGAGGGGSAGTLQIAVGADGHHQGEGAIEGSYLDYQVRYVSSHGPDAHKHSRFVCGVGRASAATSVEE